MAEVDFSVIFTYNQFVYYANELSRYHDKVKMDADLSAPKGRTYETEFTYTGGCP